MAMIKSKYLQLVEDIEVAIGDGRFAAGAKLPSVRELMGMHGLSLTTVTTAMAILEERNLIEPRARSGFFVKLPKVMGLLGKAESARKTRPGFHWWPAEDLFPGERLRKLTASIVRRNPNLAIETPRNNNPRLLRELAKRCAEVGCFVHEDDIMITHGVVEALSVALRVAASGSGTLLVQAPVAPLYIALASHLGIELKKLDIRMSEEQWLTAVEQALRDLDGPATMLIASNFHCPTGNTLSLNAKKKLLELVKIQGATIIEDDSSGDLHFGRARPLPIKAFDQGNHVIYVSAATKAFAPGLQVGWIVSSAAWRDRIESCKSISASAVDQLPQLLFADFLAHGSHLPHLRKLRLELEKRTCKFENALRPVLGSVCGLEERLGGYNRYLWAPDVYLGAEFKTECAELWPEFFGESSPVFRFKKDGISANLTFMLDGNALLQLRKCGQFLAAGMIQQT